MSITKKKQPKIEPAKCACCGEEVIWVVDREEEKVDDITHFEISRKNKKYGIEEDEIICTYENEKMLYYLCQKCFTIVLNESKTLGKVFYNKESHSFLF